MFAIPNLKFRTDTHENDAVFQAGMSDHLVGQAHTTVFVQWQEFRHRQDGAGPVVVFRREEGIELRLGTVKLLENILAETFERRLMK